MIGSMVLIDETRGWSRRDVSFDFTLVWKGIDEREVFLEVVCFGDGYADQMCLSHVRRRKK